MRVRVVGAVLLLVLVSAACGDDDETAESPAETAATTAAPNDSAPPDSAPATTQPPATTEPEQPATTQAAGGAAGATLTIGDEMWTFDNVSICAVPPGDPATTSLVLIATQGDWQLFVETIDDSGAQRLEGDGVYDRISLQNNADPSQSWLANNEGEIEKFIVVDGASITASTTFDAVSGLSDDTPGTLDANCP